MNSADRAKQIYETVNEEGPAWAALPPEDRAFMIALIDEASLEERRQAVNAVGAMWIAMVQHLCSGTEGARAAADAADASRQQALEALKG